MTREEAIEILRKNRPTSDPRPCGMELCDALDMAISALRQQKIESNLKVLESTEPITLEQLREMDGQPVWIHFIGGAVIRNDGWFIVSQIGKSAIFLSGKVSVYKNFWYYGETWLAYRQKPEEGTV